MTTRRMRSIWAPRNGQYPQLPDDHHLARTASNERTAGRVVRQHGDVLERPPALRRKPDLCGAVDVGINPLAVEG